MLMKSILANINFDTTGSLGCAAGASLATVVSKQAAAGLRVVSDTRRRAADADTDFFAGLGGIEKTVIEAGHVYQPYPVMTALLKLSGHINWPGQHAIIDSFKALKSAADTCGVIARATVPAPSTLLARVLSETEWAHEYANADMVAEDIASTYRNLLTALHDAGCRFVLFEDTAWSQLADDSGLKELLLGGTDPTEYSRLLTAVNAGAIDSVEADMAIALHPALDIPGEGARPCGDYAHAAHVFDCDLFDAFYLDFHVDSSNDFSVLARIPEGKKVMLGLLSPEKALAGKRAGLRESMESASRHYPAAALGISLRSGESTEITVSVDELFRLEDLEPVTRTVEEAVEIS